jgi:hypothetical protein
LHPEKVGNRDALFSLVRTRRLRMKEIENRRGSARNKLVFDRCSDGERGHTFRNGRQVMAASRHERIERRIKHDVSMAHDEQAVDRKVVFDGVGHGVRERR